ncbi:MAG: hypothetical protein WKF33_00750 [Thermoleophilaceae bacterium]
MDVSISSELTAELCVGDVVAVPPSVGEPRAFEVVGEPRDGWVRVRPARDSAAPLTEENGRDSEQKERQRRLASNARLDQTQHETERGLEMLREAGFGRVAEAMERNDRNWGYGLGLDARLREDVAEREADAT